MKPLHLTGIAALGVCLGTGVAQAQRTIDDDDYYSPPAGAGMYTRFGIGGSGWETGQLKQFGGQVNQSVNYSTGFTTDIAIGYAFNRYLALDVETGYLGADIKSVSGMASANSHLFYNPILVNAIFSIPIPHSLVTPYIGVGAGGAISVFDTDSLNDGVNFVGGREDDTVFAWQAFAGLKFRINHQMSVGVKYKYFASDDPTFTYPPLFFGSNFDVKFKGAETHSIMATFDLRF